MDQPVVYWNVVRMDKKKTSHQATAGWVDGVVSVLNQAELMHSLPFYRVWLKDNNQCQ